MGDRSVHNLLFEEKPIVEQFSNTVHTALVFAQNVQNALDDIKDNTKQLFWWTSTFVCICLGLFLLGQLVRLRREMNRMVHYQEVFRSMWEEDKEVESYRWEQDRKDRRAERERKAATRRSRSYGPTKPKNAPTSSVYDLGKDEEDPRTFGSGLMGRPGPSPFGPQVDDALDSAPPPGPARDEWIHALASMTQERRRAHYQGQHQVEEVEEDDEDYWG